jgi:hypothetical protein
MKRIIAAHRATFRNATESPFGSSDEIGMLNLITAESRDAIMSTADAGKMIDLSVDYFVGMPSWVRAKDPSYQLWMTRIPLGEKITNSAGVDPEFNDRVSYSCALPPDRPARCSKASQIARRRGPPELVSWGSQAQLAKGFRSLYVLIQSTL